MLAVDAKIQETAGTLNKKLQSTLKKLEINNIPGIIDVNIIKNDGSALHFTNPKLQEQKQEILRIYR